MAPGRKKKLKHFTCYVHFSPLCMPTFGCLTFIPETSVFCYTHKLTLKVSPKNWAYINHIRNYGTCPKIFSYVLTSPWCYSWKCVAVSRKTMKLPVPFKMVYNYICLSISSTDYTILLFTHYSYKLDTQIKYLIHFTWFVHATLCIWIQTVTHTGNY